MREMFRFDDARPAQPIPVLATDPDGSPRDADGVKFFDAAQAAERSGISAADLADMWRSFAKDIIGDAAASGEVVRDLDGNEQPLTFDDLSDADVRERATRMLRAGEFSVDEWAAFADHAEAMGYNWRARECYPKRVINPDSGKPEVVCIAKIEALERRVLASAAYNGMNGPFYSADGETWKPVWRGEAPPAYCKIELFRHGVERPHVVVTTYDEFQPRDDDDNVLPPNHWWRVRYCVMLSKNTRAKGFRECFRDAIGNVYIAEEFSDAPPQRRRASQRKSSAEPGPRPVQYARDAELGGDADETISTEAAARRAMTAAGVPESAQQRFIAGAREKNPLGEDDSPEAFWGGVVGVARMSVGGRRRLR